MIYFAHAEGTDHVKIGFTNGEPKKRLQELQTSCPHKLVLLGCISGSRNDEAKWHHDFASERVSGEWFSLSGRLVAAICKVISAPAPEQEKLYGFYDEPEVNRLRVGEVAGESGEYIRLKLYVGLSISLIGIYELSGEVLDVRRESCRLFNDFECLRSEVRRLMSLHMSRHKTRREEPQKNDAATVDTLRTMTMAEFMAADFSSPTPTSNEAAT